jgi:hypothetical protein
MQSQNLYTNIYGFFLHRLTKNRGQMGAKYAGDWDVMVLLPTDMPGMEMTLNLSDM